MTTDLYGPTRRLFDEVENFNQLWNDGWRPRRYHWDDQEYIGLCFSFRYGEKNDFCIGHEIGLDSGGCDDVHFQELAALLQIEHGIKPQAVVEAEHREGISVETDHCADWTGQDGERYVTLDGQDYRADRLAWLLTTGTDPGENNILHRDGDKLNLRFDNLILVADPVNPLPH